MVFHEARGYARSRTTIPLPSPPHPSAHSLPSLFLFWIWAWMWQLVYTIFGLMGSPRGMPGNDENNYYPRSYSARSRLRNDLAVCACVHSRFFCMYVFGTSMAIPSILSIVDINWTRNHCPVPRSHPWSPNWQNPNSLVWPIKIRPRCRRTSSSIPAAWYRACCAACHWLVSQ